ncbi:MAG: VOC family protein [Acidimicrobiia bacterium]|nr:VOC family protein [Acidimicrobiia bacterium]
MSQHPVIPPAKLAHFVLRTSRFDESVGWWKTVLGAVPRYENEFIAFLTFDDEHHRLAILSTPDLADNDRSATGLEHVAFTYDDLDALLATYERLKAHGIEPILPINHGMTVSLYYADPDGNQVELQVDAMDSGAAEAFMASDVFAANPLGVPLDPDDLVRRRAAGESVESLVAYVPV